MFSIEEEDLSAEWRALEAELGFRPFFGDSVENIKTVPQRLLHPVEPDTSSAELALETCQNLRASARTSAWKANSRV